MKIRTSIIFGTIFIAVCLNGCGGGGGGGSSDGSAATSNIPTKPQDTSKPVVNSSTPAHKSVGVGTTSAITLTFNESIDPATINPQSFLLENGSTPIPGSITYVGMTAQFKPASTLAAGAVYTATVTTGVKDLAGNALAANYSWQFTTGETPDSTAPTVVTTYPADASMGVALNSAIAVTFNEEIDPAAINAQTITLLKDRTIPVAGTVTHVGTTALFKPAGNLAAGAIYTATVTTGVKDLAGNALAAPFTWVFTIGNTTASDTLGPEVLAVSPANLSQNVPVDSAIVVSFNEPILPFYYGLIDGRPVAVSFNDTYTTVTLKPTNAMNTGAIYTTLIRLQDMAGNLMPAAVGWQFSTNP